MSPLNIEKYQMSYFSFSGKLIIKFRVEKGLSGTNHSTKPTATVCQPSSQPNTRQFTALTSKDRRLELLNWGMKQQSTPNTQHHRRFHWERNQTKGFGLETRAPLPSVLAHPDGHE